MSYFDVNADISRVPLSSSSSNRRESRLSRFCDLARRLTVPGQDWCVPRVIVITLILIPREVIDTINKLTDTD